MKYTKCEDLDKHFKSPKILSPFYNVKRVPRKLKKEIKNIYWDVHCDRLNVNTLLWYILEKSNPNYKRFLIKKICEHDKRIRSRV